MKAGPEIILIVALAFGAWIFWRLTHRGQIAASILAQPPPPASPATSIPMLQLGQYAVAPNKQWLVLGPGGAS